jgi:hypothetical protein
MRKFFILFLFSLAYGVVLGHNFVPHHHDHEQDHKHSHEHSSNHHDDEHDDGLLNHLFDDFSHDSQNYTVQKASANCLNFYVVISVIIPDNFSLNELLIPPLLHYEPFYIVSISDPGSKTFGLRAPPAF